VKTSDSDVSIATIEGEMEFKREPIEFFVVESEDSNAAVIDFIGDKIDVLTMLTYKEDFQRDCSNRAILKREHPEFHIPILAIHID
jgi:hypothetical protein